MKLAIAASILAQTVSSVHSSASLEKTTLVTEQVKAAVFQSKVLKNKTADKLTTFALHDALQQSGSEDSVQVPETAKRGLRHDMSKNCDPLSTDPDIGILSCGDDYYCNPSPTANLGGICKKQETATSSEVGELKNRLFLGIKDAQDCDPTQPDIGRLGCNFDEVCVPDMKSEKGGLCVPSRLRQHRRNLQSASYCDPESPTFKPDCDCSNFDASSGTGTINCPSTVPTTCLGTKFYGCANTCYDSRTIYSFQGGTLGDIEYCSYFTTPYAQSFCRLLGADYVSCAVKLDGETCTSCDIYTYTFECSNLSDGLSGSLADRSILPIVQSCYTPVEGEVCNLCGDTSYIPPEKVDVPVNVPGFGDTTCNGIRQASVFNNQISTEKCPEVRAAVAESCCLYQCNLCGPGSRIPERNLDVLTDVPGYGSLSCGELLSTTVAEAACPAVAASIATSCCAPECKVCGTNGVLLTSKFDEIVIGQVTCGNINFLSYTDASLGEDRCSLYSEIARDTCCLVSEPCSVCGGTGSIPSDRESVTTSVPGFGDFTCYEIYFASYVEESLEPGLCTALKESARQECCQFEDAPTPATPTPDGGGISEPTQCPIASPVDLPSEPPSPSNAEQNIATLSMTISCLCMIATLLLSA